MTDFTRRYPGEIVRRKPGSAFLGAAEPGLVRLSDARDGALHRVESWPCSACGRDACTEWANVQIVTGEHRGHWLCHLLECEMADLTPEDRALLQEEMVEARDD